MGRDNRDTVGTVDSSDNPVAVDTLDTQDSHRVQVVLDTPDIPDTHCFDTHNQDVADSYIARKVLAVPVDVVAHWGSSGCHCKNHIARIEVEPVAAQAQEVEQ